jgi:hypothetical protein
MWKIQLMKILGILFKSIPLETLLAKIFSWTIKKMASPEDITKVSLSIKRCVQSLNIMSDIIADSEVSEDEISIATTEANALRVKLIEAWSNMESAKSIEAKLNK